MSMRLACAAVLGCGVLGVAAQHTCEDQNNDGVVDDGTGKQPAAFTQADCATGYTLRTDLADAACATFECTSDECCLPPTDLPHPVDGGSITFTAVSPTTATLSWYAPEQGEYNADILGYNIQISKVCVLDEQDTTVNTGTFGQQPGDARTLRTAAITGPSTGTATVEATGTGLTSYTPSGGDYSSFDDDSVIDTVKGTVLGDCGGSTSDWTDVTGVYSPVTGQDHNGQCIDACAATACAVPVTVTGVVDPTATPVVLQISSAAVAAGSKVLVDGIVGTIGTDFTSGLNGNTYYAQITAGTAGSAVTEIALYTDADFTDAVAGAGGLSYTSGGTGFATIHHSCTGCYPQDPSVDAGCYPGAEGYPTEPLTSHTVTGLDSDSYYLFKVRAYNHFGTGEYGEPSYALHTHGAPTAPLSLAAWDDTTTWQCANGFVVGASVLEDGTNDCGDHSDEVPGIAASASVTTRFTGELSGNFMLNWEAPANAGVGTDNCAPISFTITDIAVDGPAVLTVDSAAIPNGRRVRIDGIVGTIGTDSTDGLNGNTYYAQVTAGNDANDVTEVTLFTDAALTAGVSTAGLGYTSGGYGAVQAYSASLAQLKEGSATKCTTEGEGVASPVLSYSIFEAGSSTLTAHSCAPPTGARIAAPTTNVGQLSCAQPELGDVSCPDTACKFYAADDGPSPTVRCTMRPGIVGTAPPGSYDSSVADAASAEECAANVLSAAPEASGAVLAVGTGARECVAAFEVVEDWAPDSNYESCVFEPLVRGRCEPYPDDYIPSVSAPSESDCAAIFGTDESSYPTASAAWKADCEALHCTYETATISGRSAGGAVLTGSRSPRVVITGMDADTGYAFTVTATNAAGEGVATAAVEVSTPALASKPNAAPVALQVTDTQITLSYASAMSNVDINGNSITGYKLYAQSAIGPFTVTGVSAADPAVLTIDSAPIATGAEVAVASIVGTAGSDATNGLNGKTFYAKVIAGTAGSSATQIELYTDAALSAGADTSGLAYTSGGTISSWQAASRLLTNNGEDPGWASDPPDVNHVNQDSYAVDLGTTNERADALWLEITQQLNDDFDYDDAVVGDANTVDVPYLVPGTAYRFKIAFVNSVGTGAESDPSATFRTLDSEILSVRMYSGPPCVYQEPTATTFAASAVGTGVKYRWELVYKSGAGLAALNEDSSNPDANDFDANMDGDDDAIHSGRTTHVESGSTIALPGSSNCLNADCSVMSYQLPLPGFDEAVANYDEMEIRVVAYNTRGQVRESTVFGWTPTDTHNYQTIEYCGCTDPLDDNYWDLATYMIPDSCAGVEDWQGSGVTELSVVNAGEFEYYQFAVEERTFDVQVSLRVDDGAVDMFVSTSGVANPDLDSTHIVELQQLAVTGFAVVNLDYEHLKGERSVYITIRGASGVSDPHCVGSAAACEGAEHVFGRYTLLAQSSNFRSYSCSASDTDAQDSKGEIDCSSSSTAATAISRQVLQNEVTLTSVLPSHHYDFYEYYYPHAPADLDVEISVDVDEVATPSGAIQVYASKTERYPGPQRSLGEGAYPGYWTGVSHTCIAQADDTDGKKLYFTMAPTDHLDPTPNILYLSVFGATPHAQGTELPSTKYDISAKVYRYRVESDLLEAIVEDGPLTEDRRYSVVTQDNFNYYEVPLTSTTTKVLVEIIVHYGTIDVYRSKTKLPTQDLSNPGNDLIDRNDIGSFYIDSEDLNIPGGYVYLGLIGRTPDSSYDIKVTLVELDAAEPTELFYCPDLSTNVGTSAACDAKLDSFDTTGAATFDGTGYAFFKLYIGTKDVDKYVTERTGAGAAPTDLTTSADTWGTDWTETSISTWSDSFSDEWDTDVVVEATSAGASGATDFNVVGSVLEKYPAIPRAYCSDGSTAEPCSHNSGVSPCTDTVVAVADRAAAKAACEAAGETWSVESADNDGTSDDTLEMTVDTFGGKWLYIGFTTTGDETVAGDVTVSFSNAGTREVGDVSTDEAYTAPTCSSLGDCNSNGVCVVDGDAAFCVCNTGYYGADCSTASGLDLPTSSDPSVDISGDNSIGSCTNEEVLEIGDEFCVVPEVVTGATETITLDCVTGIDDCRPRGTATKVGYVECQDDGVTCTQLMPAPMATVSIDLENVPSYGRLHTYIDGLPYPRAGANTFTIADGGTLTKTLKLYALTPRAKHSVMLVLTTDQGESIATVQRHFSVSYMAGSGCTKSGGVECSGQGVCHDGYCICYDGYFGTDCADALLDETGVISNTEMGSFEAGKAYRERVEAIALDKIGKAKFVSSMQLEETTTELARSKASLDSIKTTVNAKLQDTIYAEDDPTTGSDEGSTLHKAIIANKATTDAAVEKLRAKQARDTIKIQQAKQESARLSTANREAYLDHKRALYAHQTSMQNEFAASKVEMTAEIAAKNAAISAAFTEGRFIKNQLRTANGPTTKISDLKTQECTTDQFFHTSCVDVDYDDDQFGETQYSSIPR